VSLGDLSSGLQNGETGIVACPVAGVDQAAATLYSGSLMKRKYNRLIAMKTNKGTWVTALFSLGKFNFAVWNGLEG
jgi:hypothetical protein